MCSDSRILIPRIASPDSIFARRRHAVPRVRNYIAPVDEKTIARRLRDLRKRRGRTQTEMAQALGVDQTLISAYERGAVRLHGAIVTAFAKVLKTSTDEILGFKEGKPGGLYSDRRFIRRLERIEKLPKRSKQALLKTIDTYLAGAEKR